MSNPLKILQNIPLKNYTTFKIGGPAKFFVAVKKEEELKEALGWAKENGQPVFILGSGSNILISDVGFAGLVIKMENKDFSATGEKVLAGAGIILSDLIEKCRQKNLMGLENLAGIPGTLGGAMRGNAGAWGEEIGKLIASVAYFDQNFNYKKLNHAECQFSYRQSIFKTKPDFIIWQVELNLKFGEAAAIQEKVKEILAQRYKNQPTKPSAGCVFKNIKGEKFKDFLKNNPNIKLPDKFLVNQALPAAWLIEECDLKGQKIGDAQISEKHANFIINLGQATADNIIKLISLMKSRVRDKFEVQLEEEIQLVGF